LLDRANPAWGNNENNRIKIENFRSIKTGSVEAADFNVFVGQNNHGKTNLFAAIDWFYSGKGDVEKLRFGRAGNDEVAVEVEFGDVADGLDKMKNERNREAIKKLLVIRLPFEFGVQAMIPKLEKSSARKRESGWKRTQPGSIQR